MKFKPGISYREIIKIRINMFTKKEIKKFLDTGVDDNDDDITG